MSTSPDKSCRGITRRRFVSTASAIGASAIASNLLPSGRMASAAEKEFDLFRVGIWSGMPNLDPEQNSIRTCLIAQNWIFDPLVWRNKDTNELEPYLAEEYSFIGKNTWRFKIREGVKFHNGKPLTANSVKFSMERRLDEKLASPNRKTFLDIAEVNVVNQHTIDFVCKNPFPVLPAYFPIFSIMEEGHYTENPKAYVALNPLGSGPKRYPSAVALRGGRHSPC